MRAQRTSLVPAHVCAQTVQLPEVLIQLRGSDRVLSHSQIRQPPTIQSHGSWREEEKKRAWTRAPRRPRLLVEEKEEEEEEEGEEEEEKSSGPSGRQAFSSFFLSPRALFFL